jgi:hypothetical protein
MTAHALEATGPGLPGSLPEEAPCRFSVFWRLRASAKSTTLGGFPFGSLIAETPKKFPDCHDTSVTRR